jgi:hypothetical protein
MDAFGDQDARCVEEGLRTRAEFPIVQIGRELAGASGSDDQL